MHALQFSLSVPTSGFITYVGRGFTPRQAGREGPPYGYETGSGQLSVAVRSGSLAIQNPHLMFVVAGAGDGRSRHRFLDASDVLAAEREVKRGQ
jgi:hypothetical protein